MSVNQLNYEDVTTMLHAIYGLATGMSDPSDPPILGDFTSVATKTLALGTEKIMNALTQVLSKTIFAERPYEAKFRSLELDQVEWGNIVRKINFADGSISTPETTYDPTAGGMFPTQGEVERMGEGADSPFSPWNGKDPAVVQTNFYGTATAADSYKIRETALMGAFRGPEELAAFISSLMTFINNRHEQFIETLARGALDNYILGKEMTDLADAAKGKMHVVHLLTEYNEQTELSLTAKTVYQPENFKPFMAWVYARIASVSDMMTERSNMFHTDLIKSMGDNNPSLYVLRHTPKRDQKVLLYAPLQHMSAARALADTYHDSYLRYTDVELINYFQMVKYPQNVSGDFTYLNPNGDGTLLESEEPRTIQNIFGLIVDRNTVGYMRQNTRVLTSPYNPADQSYTLWWHLAGKWVNDFSENGCLFLLD